MTAIISIWRLPSIQIQEDAAIDAYDASHTTVLLVDPCNDLLSEGCKTWPRLEPVGKEVGLLANLRSVVGSAREAGVRVAFVPHRR
ncbi:hypothetical protein ACWDA7_38095 [Streptomyces sp. NPDC001156]